MSQHIGQKVIILLVRAYQLGMSPDKNILVRIGAIHPRPTCVFYPTCSEYMILTVEKYGVFRGVGKGLARIGRCRKGAEPSVDMP